MKDIVRLAWDSVWLLGDEIRAKFGFERKWTSGFSASSTAEEVTVGIDGTGLTAIVTGASSGIGTETTRVLALRGVHVVMGVRNTDSGTKVKEAILMENPDAKIDVMELDLSSMASVRKFASEYKSSGHFLLTNLLLETMKNTARESHKEGRIVIVSSEGHRFPYRGGVLFDKINDESSYHVVYAYGKSKLANILHANELAKCFKEEGVDITANSLHPGIINTNLFRYHSTFRGLMNIGKYFVKSIPQGAATTCYVALHPQVKGVSGEYFSDSNIGKQSALARDEELAKKLWDFSLSLTDPCGAPC